VLGFQVLKAALTTVTLLAAAYAAVTPDQDTRFYGFVTCAVFAFIGNLLVERVTISLPARRLAGSRR
jgi:hypothetical protein